MVFYYYLGLLDLKKSKLSFSRRNVREKNNFLSRNMTKKMDEKIEKKMTKFEANFRLVKGDNSAQIKTIYKAKTFICKNMCNTLFTSSFSRFSRKLVSLTLYCFVT
jgi:hypothetical protein